MKLPVIALVGRPNVGKSTLFNCFTRSRAALVADLPGLTRDRQYGRANYDDREFIVIDTGGLSGEDMGIDAAMAGQSREAVSEADVVLFLVDGKTGIHHYENELAQELRRIGKPVILVVNKTDGQDPDVVVADFYSLGLTEVMPIAAAHGRGVQQLVAALWQHLPEEIEATDAETADLAQKHPGTRIAIIGKPNVGKSTLTNRILGEERVVVYDQPGTTRDSVYIPFERHGKDYTIIDTAGVRRRARVKDTVEKFSVIKALQAINDAHVVLYVIDAREGIVEQDQHLLGHVLEAGRSLVIAVNKWDGLSTDDRDQVKVELHRRLTFVDYAKVHFISALHGSGVGDLFGFVDAAYTASMQDISTPKLTKLLEAAIAQHQPPLVKGRRIKLRYAHAGGKNPPIIVLHGNQLKSLPGDYKRYLTNYFRKALNMIGTPIRLELKQGDNPYEGRRNKLTPRQQRKRKRMMKFYKKKDK